MPAALPAAAVAASLAVDYLHGAAPAPLLAGDDVLAVFGFGDDAPRGLDDPRYQHIPLQPFGAAPCEVWRAAVALVTLAPTSRRNRRCPRKPTPSVRWRNCWSRA
jgi:hypothetical protein